MIIDRELVYDHWYRLWRLRLRMPDGAEVERHLEHHGAAVAVLPYDPERRVALLVSMPRAAILDAGAPPLLEAVAGHIAVDAERSARAEAMEEAGVRLGALDPVGTVWLMPALSTERLSLFLAAYSADDRIGPGGGAPDEHENITVHELALCELGALRGSHAIEDAKTLLLLQALELKDPTLFA